MTNQSVYYQWTIGPVFYSTVVVAEAFGRSGKAQIVDLQANTNNQYTPGYAIYDGGSLARVALFNYINDPTGASDLTVNINVGGGQTGQPNGVPASVKVKYVQNEYL